MPLSSSISAGAQGLATQYNNLRSDAIALTIDGTSGEAFSIRDLVYIDPTDNRAYKADADVYAKGDSGLEFFYAASTASGSAQAVTLYVEGGYITGFSGLTPNTFYYPSGTAGAITTTIGKYGCSVAWTVSSSVILFIKGTKKDHRIIETVVAGANWVEGLMLYQKKSDNRWYPFDTTVPESGIADNWGFAVITHTGGAGSSQQVYLQGSVVNGPGFFTAGGILYSVTNGGGYTANVIPGVDDYYRQVCAMYSSTRYHIVGGQFMFLPSGIQEKGFCAAGNAAGGSASGDGVITPINFKKVMANTPSSLTLSLIDGLEYNTPSIENMNRFGAAFYLSSSTDSGLFWWKGTYTTVGN